MTSFTNKSRVMWTSILLLLVASLSNAQVVPITPLQAPTSTTIAQSSPATATAIPSTAANGGITITQPAQTADASYYKIASGVNVTFGWNFTSVLSYPSSLVVQAYCSDNSNTYTIASSIAGTATSVVWAPYLYDQQASQNGQPALIQATYRLQIYDERGLTVAASPGRFAPNQNVQFALYIPQPYTPIADGWFCSACSGAASLQIPKPLLIAATTTSLLVIFGGWNFLRRS